MELLLLAAGMFAVCAVAEELTPLVAHWPKQELGPVIADQGVAAFAGAWMARGSYVRRDVRNGNVAAARGSNTHRLHFFPDGRLEGVLNIKNAARYTYTGTWSYTNGVLVLPPYMPALTNSYTCRVLWRSHDEFELQYVPLEYRIGNTVHHGRYDERGDLSIRMETALPSGETFASDVMQSPAVYRRSDK